MWTTEAWASYSEAAHHSQSYKSKTHRLFSLSTQFPFRIKSKHFRRLLKAWLKNRSKTKQVAKHNIKNKRIKIQDAVVPKNVSKKCCKLLGQYVCTNSFTNESFCLLNFVIDSSSVKIHKHFIIAVSLFRRTTSFGCQPTHLSSLDKFEALKVETALPCHIDSQVSHSSRETDRVRSKLMPLGYP